MLNNLRNWLWNTIVNWLNDLPKGNRNIQAINNFDHMLRDLQVSDVVLFEGRSRVSEVIKVVTLSPWTHAALYVGRVNEIADSEAKILIKKHYKGDPNEPLIIESLLGFGTVVNPLSDYVDDNLRICRPDGLSFEDQNKVVCFAIEHLGMNYDVRQLLDLARFMFPYAILPRRWRSSLFQHNAGRPTNIVCSSMIARCFQSVNFPLLPTIKSDQNDRLRFHKRNFRLFVPTDFDYSPYFSILKFPAWPLAMKEGYKDLPWTDDEPINDETDIDDNEENKVTSLLKSLENKAKKLTESYSKLTKAEEKI